MTKPEYINCRVTYLCLNECFPASLYKWALTQSSNCLYGDPKTMSHIVDSCLPGAAEGNQKRGGTKQRGPKGQSLRPEGPRRDGVLGQGSNELLSSPAIGYGRAV